MREGERFTGKVFGVYFFCWVSVVGFAKEEMEGEEGGFGF